MAKRFKFSLERLLRHRKNLEQIAQSELLVVQAELAREVEKLQNLEDEKMQARLRTQLVLSEGGSASAGLDQINDFLSLQDIRIERQKKVIQEVESRVEKYFENLRQKALDSKIVERLKEKKHLEFEADRKKAEQKQLDDLTTLRAAKRIQGTE